MSSIEVISELELLLARTYYNYFAVKHAVYRISMLIGYFDI